MNLFHDVKDQVTTLEAARRYGLDVKRSGMVCCPFHDDKTPSMKVDKRFHCFGCGADGNVIDFTAKLFSLSPLEAARKLADDFGIPYQKEKAKNKSPPAKKSKPTISARYQEFEDRFFLTLIRYKNLLDKWQIEYAPKEPDEEWDEHFCEALQNRDQIQELIRSFTEADFEERVDIINEYGKKVRHYEYRLRESVGRETESTGRDDEGI